MMDQFDKMGASIIGCKEVPLSDVGKYGIVGYSEQIGELYKIDSLIEKPSIERAPSSQAIIGRYILTPQIFSILEEILPDQNNEIQLTDALDSLNQHESIFSYIIKGNRYDIGDKFGFLQASIDFALKRPELKQKLFMYLKQLDF